MDEGEKIILYEFFEKLLKNQKDLSPEFQKVLDDNFWELIGEKKMKELTRIQAQSYDDRMNLIQALNNCGYATRVIEEENKLSSSINNYFVVIYEGIEKGE